MRYYRGTAGNDTVVADSTDDGTFTGFGQGYDVVTGGQGNDVFKMSVDLNRDVIDGGGGENRLDYSASDHALTIDLNHGDVFGTFSHVVPVYIPPSNVGPNGTVGVVVDVTESYQALVATVHNIQDVTGSDLADNIIGNAADNKIDGGGGDDHIFGGAGANVLNGDDGNDTITMQLDGTGLAADMDTIDGGNDIDTLAFTFNSALSGNFGVDANLSGHDVFLFQYVAHPDGTPVPIGTPTLEATITNVENVTGTGNDDFISGDSNANTLLGGGGADVLNGGGGNDYLDGGDGNDRFIEFGANHGGDTIHGGTGIDTVEYTSGGGVVPGAPDPDHPVIVTLAEPGNAGTAIMFVDGATPLSPPGVVEDYLYDIENVTGSDFDDILTGNSQDNTLLGGFGSDHINGGGGRDLINGGPGHDILTGGPDADTFQFSDRAVGANADTITDFTTGLDHIDFSPFYSQAAAFHNHSGPPPTFIGSAPFSGAGDELRVFTDHDGDTIVQLQTPGGLSNGFPNTTADLEINLGHHAVSHSDFLF